MPAWFLWSFYLPPSWKWVPSLNMPGFWSYLYLKLGTFSTESQVKSDFLSFHVIFKPLVLHVNDLTKQNMITWGLPLPTSSKKSSLKSFHPMYQKWWSCPTVRARAVWLTAVSHRNRRPQLEAVEAVVTPQASSQYYFMLATIYLSHCGSLPLTNIAW